MLLETFTFLSAVGEILGLEVIQIVLKLGSDLTLSLSKKGLPCDKASTPASER
jgi:hypothetical protein